MVQTLKKRKIPAWGKEAPCKAAMFPYAKDDGAVSWGWCPCCSWLLLILYVALVMCALGLSWINLAFVGYYFDGGLFNRGLFFFFVLGVVPIIALLIWRWNALKQDAYSLARGKSIQAKELWKTVDPMFHYQAKDTFCETRYGGKTLRVLRDGTIEMIGLHNAFESAFGGGGYEAGGQEGTEAADTTDGSYGHA
jgi:hypothetical protein